MKYDRHSSRDADLEVTNGASWNLSKCWECVVTQYGLPFVHHCISVIYAIYTSCSAVNVILFLVKIIPTMVYMTNFVRNVYLKSRNRMKLYERELEDLQLQIQIIKIKLSVRDTEFTERTEELRKRRGRLRKVHAKVRRAIAVDEELRNSLHEHVSWDDDSDTHTNNPPEASSHNEDEVVEDVLSEREFILQLLKELKYDQEAAGESSGQTGVTRGVLVASERGLHPEESVHTSASDAEVKQNCRVKIVKVTNIYKVAYLKHFIKQEKQRQATQQAILEKKVETVKKFLEECQKKLAMVINSEISSLNMDPYVEAASQEAMGDYMKQDLRDSLEMDSEIRNGFKDNQYEPVLCWDQSVHRNYPSNFEDIPDSAASREIIDQNYDKHQSDGCDMSGCRSHAPNEKLGVLMEETDSQVAIDDVRSEASYEYDCRDAFLA